MAKQLGRGSAGFGHPPLTEAAVIAALTETQGSVRRAAPILGTSHSAVTWFCQRYGIVPAAFQTPESDDQIPRTELAWVAGLFDGEGSVNLKFWAKHPKCRAGAWSVQADITNTHAPTIVAVRDVLGFGRITRTVRPPRRDAYHWRVYSRNAERFLRLIQPFVVTKREQIRLALDGVRIRRESPRVNRGRGHGKGGPAISGQTHEKLFLIRQNIMRVNKHQAILGEVENG